jgi:hypothetical protein
LRKVVSLTGPAFPSLEVFVADNNCLRCRSPMDSGYLLDRGDANSANVAEWVGDAPEPRWYGLKTKGHPRIKLVAYRCRDCGMVEFRAPAPE